jgi:hypothetical protein
MQGGYAADNEAPISSSASRVLHICDEPALMPITCCYPQLRELRASNICVGIHVWERESSGSVAEGSIADQGAV